MNIQIYTLSLKFSFIFKEIKIWTTFMFKLILGVDCKFIK